jgi:hypothetical protein
MAQNTLVGALVEDGLEITAQLDRSDIPISAAWWVKPMYDPEAGYRDWKFFLASSWVDELGRSEFYKRVHDAIQCMPDADALFARISVTTTNVVGLRDPITQDVFKIIKRFGGGPPIPVGHCRLGTIDAEEVNIFYVRLPPPWQEGVLKTPIYANDPSPRQERAAMVPTGGSGTSPVQAGWPPSVPAGTVVYLPPRVTESAPEQDVFVKLPDGRWGITRKSNIEIVQSVGPQKQSLTKKTTISNDQ